MLILRSQWIVWLLKKNIKNPLKKNTKNKRSVNLDLRWENVLRWYTFLREFKIILDRFHCLDDNLDNFQNNENLCNILFRLNLENFIWHLKSRNFKFILSYNVLKFYILVLIFFKIFKFTPIIVQTITNWLIILKKLQSDLYIV